MATSNLPWKYSHFKELLRYRNWEAVKNHRDHKKRQHLLDAFDRGKKTLFIHIPKTAGVSLIRAYEDCFADARHSPALMYKLLLGKRYGQFATFSIVRNPWARLYSAYHFLKSGGLIETDRQMGLVLIDQCPTFERFVKEWLPKYGVCSYGHFVPQHEFVCGWSEDIIVDRIVKLERLDDDWPDLARSLRFPKRQIQRANASNNSDYREYFDTESIEIVRQLYGKDINLFDYLYD